MNIVLTFATKRKNCNHTSRQFMEKWNSISVITVIVLFIGEEIKKNIYSKLITLIWLNMIIINLICTLCKQCPLLWHSEQKSRILFWKLPFIYSKQLKYRRRDKTSAQWALPCCDTVNKNQEFCFLNYDSNTVKQDRKICSKTS